jgi:hypothetical protein
MNSKLPFTAAILWFTAITIFAMLVSCESREPNAKANPHRIELDSSSKHYDQNYRVYTLEGCEYIVVGVGNSKWGSHKGNCKNPIHQVK